MYLIVQPQITRDNRSEFVKKEICDPCKLELNEIPYWHGKKQKPSVRRKVMDFIMNFTLRLFSRAEFSSVTEDFFCNTDQACSLSIFKYFSNMQGRGRRRQKENCSLYSFKKRMAGGYPTFQMKSVQHRTVVYYIQHASTWQTPGSNL